MALEIGEKIPIEEKELLFQIKEEIEGHLGT